MSRCRAVETRDCVACASQACTAANRIYVQRGVADEFAARLATRLSAMP
ncbi:aldehyde dehydrogenase family protein, partial [Nocardia aurea]